MLDARADDERRHLAPGEKRRKKSAKPLSPARIARAFAVLRAAMNAAVPGKIMVSPCDGVELPRARKVKPLAWTAQREAAFRAALDKRMRAASAERDLTTVEKQELWAAPDLRPCRSWSGCPATRGGSSTPSQGERLFALFSLAAYCGLRRDEVAGLTWAEVDLDEGVAFVRETGGGDGPKSEAGVRAVPLPAVRGAGAEGLAGRSRPQTGSPGAATGRTRAWCSPARTARRCRDSGSASGSRRSPTAPGSRPVQVPRPAPRRRVAVQGGRGRHEAISAMLGHSRTQFTDATYVLVFPEVAKAAAEAAAAVVPPCQ